MVAVSGFESLILYGSLAMAWIFSAMRLAKFRSRFSRYLFNASCESFGVHAKAI